MEERPPINGRKRAEQPRKLSYEPKHSPRPLHTPLPKLKNAGIQTDEIPTRSAKKLKHQSQIEVQLLCANIEKQLATLDDEQKRPVDLPTTALWPPRSSLRHVGARRGSQKGSCPPHCGDFVCVVIIADVWSSSHRSLKELGPRSDP